VTFKQPPEYDLLWQSDRAKLYPQTLF